MIKLLSKETIDKIAAGEVVERPVNVVKELLDNAVDSGAGQINVEIKDGGIGLIRVTDNGSGIERDDIQKAFLRHATSKLTDASDLYSLKTMGFRGEALSSIAAVARVELITKCEKELTGSRYLIEGGKEISLKEIGVPGGTTMIVRDLFYNLPVRKEFLKSAKTEGAYIRDMVEKCALSCPEISFSFINDGRQIFHTPGNGRLKDAVYTIFGAEITAELIPVNYEKDGIKISGLISKPVLSRSKRDCEIYFVNKRYIKNNIIENAIETAYEGYLMQHRFPFTVLSLLMDPGKVDVNIHPKKSEVRFTCDREIFDAVFECTVNALRHREHISEAVQETVKPEKKPETHVEPFEKNELKKVYKTDTAVLSDCLTEVMEKAQSGSGRTALTVQALKDNTASNNGQNGLKDISSETVYNETEKPYKESTLPETFLSPSSKPYYKFVGQVFDTYWIIEYNKEMYIIDQHAAHEKVNYEKMMKAVTGGDVTSQNIIPMMITVRPDEAVILSDSLDSFNEAGFEIECAGECDFIVRAVPAMLPELSQKELILSMIEELSVSSKGVKGKLISEKIAGMACKASVKGGDRVSLEEMKALIDELLSLDDPYNCPHGRPTIVKFSRYQLDRMFKRVL